MEDWQKRVELERDELAEKVYALSNFLRSDAIGDVSDYQREILMLQYGSMSSYLHFLNLRIKDFY